jgi:hypothetical protein
MKTHFFEVCFEIKIFTFKVFPLRFFISFKQFSLDAGELIRE